MSKSFKTAPSQHPLSNLTEAKQACTECKRRKSRCNRAVPICASCVRNHRSCLYEKPWKTPLTRRHLNYVEAELAHARILLQRAGIKFQSISSASSAPLLHKSPMSTTPSRQLRNPTYSITSIVAQDFEFDLTPDVRIHSNSFNESGSTSSYLSELPQDYFELEIDQDYDPDRPRPSDQNSLSPQSLPESSPVLMESLSSLDTSPMDEFFEWVEKMDTYDEQTVYSVSHRD